MKVIKGLLTVVAIVIVMSIAGAFGERAGKSIVKTDPDVPEILQLVAKELRKKIPTTFANGTTIVGIEAAGKSLNYHYTVGMSEEALESLDVAAYQATLKAEVPKIVCGEMLLFLENGVTIGYKYFDADMSLLAEVYVIQSDCK